MSFVLGSALGIFVFAITAWSSMRWNKERMKRKYSYRLFPNCLLTRKPVVFIHGKKSIFYFSNYWNFIPQFLIDHGYEIIELDLPWRDEKLRKKEFVRFLELMREEELSAHFIGDVTSKSLMESLSREFSDVFQSQAIMGVREIGLPTNGTEPIPFRLHRLITGRDSNLDGRVLGLTETCDLKDVGRIYLRKLVELAESDLHLGETHEPGFNGPESESSYQPQL